MFALRLHRPLMITFWVMVGFLLLALAGLAFDDRTLLGVPIWLKPLKFAISLGIYAVTIAWLLSLLDRFRRVSWWLGTVIAVASIGEMAIIAGQAMRGRRSHFNNETALDASLYSAMGFTIVALWVATAVIAVLLLRQRIEDRAAGRAVRASLLIALAGLAIGFMMTAPTSEQRAAMAEGPPSVVGAHSVGVAEGGAGLPLVNWSTEGGDLRIGHFIGIHALQALPLLGFGLALGARRFRRLASETVRRRLMLVAAIGYASVTALVTWQALRGQSIIHPDGLTWMAAGALAVFTVAGAGWVLRKPSPQPVTVASASAS